MTNDTDRTPVLEARQMCAGYGAVEVVKDLDLVVHSGEVVALLGVNGAGKTTIVRALSGLGLHGADDGGESSPRRPEP